MKNTSDGDFWDEREGTEKAAYVHGRYIYSHKMQKSYVTKIGGNIGRFLNGKAGDDGAFKAVSHANSPEAAERLIRNMESFDLEAAVL